MTWHKDINSFQDLKLVYQAFREQPFNEYFGCVTHTRGTPFPHAGEQAHGVATGDLLQQEFSALPLGGKAGDGPHFDLYACVELLVPHVPDSLDWCRYCFVLKEKRQADLVTDETP
jgi:hypothetical protein